MEVSGLYCYNCKLFVYSRARHDFSACKCWEEDRANGFAVDGGQSDYFKVSIGSNAKYKWARIKIKEEEIDLINDWNFNKNKLGKIFINNIDNYSGLVESKNKGE